MNKDISKIRRRKPSTSLKKRQHTINSTRNINTIDQIYFFDYHLTLDMKKKHENLSILHLNIRNISKIIEKKKNSTFYNLKSTLSNTSFKNNSGNISFSQQSSTQLTPATTLEEIECLENESKKLKNIILYFL